VIAASKTVNSVIFLLGNFQFRQVCCDIFFKLRAREF
jgi:hypothetical protein